MPKTTNKIGGYVGTFSLMLAILAYLPSIAPFTPAIIAFFGDSYFDIYHPQYGDSIDLCNKAVSK